MDMGSKGLHGGLKLVVFGEHSWSATAECVGSRTRVREWQKEGELTKIGFR